MAKKLEVTFWSGVGTVTGANFFVETEMAKFLIDCGLLQGTLDAEAENRKQFPYDPKVMDYLFITHAHMDHIGRVCKLVKDGFRGIIYSTPETKELANLMLLDAIKVMEMKANATPQNEEKEEPLYGFNDLNTTFALWRTISYNTTTKINEELSVYAKDAGHILGSAMYEFSYDGRKIVFTGDSGNSPAPLLRDTETIEDADYLVVDSVYGDRNHEPKDVRDAKFRDIVKQAIDKKGALVIPAFSLERTQVILYELNHMVEEKKIPSVPIFLDSPLGTKITAIYTKESQDFNHGVQNEIKDGDDIFDFPKLSITHGSRESHEIDNIPNPKIIIAGSGMSSGGRVVAHEIKHLPDPQSTILLMGFQALGTLGRKIQDKPREVEINGEMIPVKARIEMISGYSSHKDSDGLVDLVSHTADTVKKVFVVMGEPKSSMYLVQRLRDELGVDAVYPERGKVYKLS